jgi:3-oxoacyl-[acyl-carrier-protein] synthase-1
MKSVFAVADNIFSPLANATELNFDAACRQLSGIEKHHEPNIYQEAFYASLFREIPRIEGFTRFESLCVQSIQLALEKLQDSIAMNETVLVLSSTKGNIELIEHGNYKNSEVSLYVSAKKIATYFGCLHSPIVVSNACISGVLAIGIAEQLLALGQFKNAIVCGADVLSKFIVSGFHALGAASNEVCQPFDKNRKGINLGECAATLVLSTDNSLNTFQHQVQVGKCFSSNDANHISGPSKTGLELAVAIQKTLHENAVALSEISFVNAHGTGTLFNDEMEAKAFGACAINQLPINSFKAVFGHTLGVAGVLESIITYRSLLEEKVLPSKNYEFSGTSVPLNVCRRLEHSNKKIALKTASGFGGCNAAIVFKVLG